MKHARPGRILMQMAAIIAVGAMLGAADAFYFRQIDLSTRAAPPDVEKLPVMARKPGGNHAAALPEQPATPKSDPDSAPAVNPAVPNLPTTAGGTATGVDPGAPFAFTRKEDLPPGQITVEQGKALYDADARFIDSRQEKPYAEGHVLNSMRIDTGMFTHGDPAILGMIPRDSVVVVYCNGGHCDESENLAKLLTNSGYKAVYVLHDGYPGWKAAGHPTATGADFAP